MSDNLVYRRSPDVVAASLGEKSFLLHVGDWVYLELNDSGSRIWESLDGGKSAEALTDQMLREFDVDRETCARETLEFLETLQAKRFVVPSNR